MTHRFYLNLVVDKDLNLYIFCNILKASITT